MQGKPQGLTQGLTLHCLMHSPWSSLATSLPVLLLPMLHASESPTAHMSAAGPERSGSTWLFNAVRLLLKHAHVPYDPYWITTLTTEKLQQRKHYMALVSVGYCISQLRE